MGYHLEKEQSRLLFQLLSMNKIRLSYSLLSYWKQGRHEDVFDTYLRLNTHTTPAMKRGIEFDEMVKVYAKTYKSLPPELGGVKLTNPQPALKIVQPYNDMFDLSAEIDVYDSPTIYEIKNSTARDSGDYANDFQVSMYFLLCDLAGLESRSAVIFRYDPTKKEFDTSIVHKSDRRLKDIKNIIDECGVPIYKYLEDRGVV